MGKFRESSQWIVRSLRRFVSLSFILAGMILTVRLFDLIVVSNFSNYPPSSTMDVLKGFLFDLIVYLRISSIVLFPYLCIALISQKAAKNFFVVVSLCLIVAELVLLNYFSTTHIPLGADLLGYSIDEIKHTIGTSGKLKVLPVILLVLYIAVMARIFKKHVYVKLRPRVTLIIALIMMGSWIPVFKTVEDPSGYKSEFNYYVSTNKFGFFAGSLFNHYLNRAELKGQQYTFYSDNAAFKNSSFTYTDRNYPFLHIENTPDILGKYFQFKEDPPNMVFIIVEGLGRAYSGEDALRGSFTPFLDSLMQKSLYWENCLSSSGRTFQVLPSLLASAPFGEHGFNEMAEQMPDHISLLSILKNKAGYQSMFLYGGEAEFDKMDVFLNRQGVNTIIDKKNFGTGYEELPASTKNGFSWGYGDREIFRRYLEEQNKNSNLPKADVMLTLAIHDPFIVPGQEHYNQKFDERLDSLDLSPEKKEFNRNYRKEYASVLYFDESLQYFFEEFKKHSSYENTVFIITGDHRMPEIPISTQIDRFHVPLVIYSPLLRKAEKFSSVVTHFDVTPSLVALLNGAGFISRPGMSSWLGNGLDEETAFRSLHSFVLMRNKNEIMDWLDKDLFYSNGTVYQLYSNMDIEPLEDQSVMMSMKEDLKNFIVINNYVCTNNRLIPDSLRVWTVRK